MLTELATTVGERREREKRSYPMLPHATAQIVQSPVLQERSGTAPSGWIALPALPALRFGCGTLWLSKLLF